MVLIIGKSSASMTVVSGQTNGIIGIYEVHCALSLPGLIGNGDD